MKKKWIFGFGMAAVVVLLWYFFKGDKKSEIKIVEHLIERSSLERNVMATGLVQPQNRLTIKAPVAGRVESVFVQEGDLIRKGQRLALMSSSERAALLDAAKSQGQEEVKKWEELYKATPIVAPISGTLINRNVENGQSFTTSDSLFMMSDKLTIKAQVDETDIGQIEKGQNAEIQLDAYPEKKIAAKVGLIAFDAKTVNSVTTYVVDVIPEEVLPEMRSGMTATVKFFIEVRENVLTIASEALIVKEGKFFLKIKTKDSKNKSEEREVKVGISDAKKTEVLEGASEGETVLASDFNSILGQAGAKKNSNPFMPMGAPRTRSGGGSSTAPRSRPSH